MSLGRTLSRRSSPVRAGWTSACVSGLLGSFRQNVGSVSSNRSWLGPVGSVFLRLCRRSAFRSRVRIAEHSAHRPGCVSIRPHVVVSGGHSGPGQRCNGGPALWFFAFSASMAVFPGLVRVMFRRASGSSASLRLARRGTSSSSKGACDGPAGGAGRIGKLTGSVLPVVQVPHVRSGELFGPACAGSVRMGLR